MENYQRKFNESLNKARDYLSRKQYKNARLMYFQAQNYVKDAASKAILWAELSWVYYYEKDYEKAIEATENVLIYNADYSALDDLYRVQGYAYLGLYNYALAQKYLALSLENNTVDDKQQYVKYELGKLYFRQGNYDLAYPYFREILDYFNSSNHEYTLSTLFYLGFIHYYLKNKKKSRENFQEILKCEPPDQRQASAYFGLAFLEFHDKNYLNVVSLCEKIMTLDEHFFDKESLGFLTAASYFYLGRKDIFYEYYQQMMKTYPDGRYKNELQSLHNQDSNKEKEPPEKE
jgi:tetratricopeptide (TPR) repeat protein